MLTAFCVVAADLSQKLGKQSGASEEGVHVYMIQAESSLVSLLHSAL